MNHKFNEHADSYTQYATIQRDLAAWLAEWLEANSLRAAIEVGAGTGMFTQYLAGRFRHLTAIDLAPRMLERGRRLLPTVRWCEADAWQLEGKPVDRIYSASLLHWCQSPATVLQTWRRLVKQHGRMLHGFYVAPTLVEWQQVAKELTPFEWRSQSQWTNYFAEAGWHVLRCELQTQTYRFDSSRKLLGFFHRTGAYTPRRTPVDRLRRTMAEYDRRFAIANGTPGVTSTWTFMRIEVLNPRSVTVG
jgi:SAM-dependent methyltransferase